MGEVRPEEERLEVGTVRAEEEQSLFGGSLGPADGVSFEERSDTPQEDREASGGEGLGC